MPLGDHLEELRRRLMYAILGILPIFGAGLYFGKTILNFMARPMENALGKERISGGGMQVTTALEGFMNYLKIALILAIIVGGPWIVYQLWKFIAPGLYQRERRFFYFLAPFSVLLTAGGVAFMYYVMLKFVLTFFVTFNEGLLTRPPTPTVQVAPGVFFPSLPMIAGDPVDPKPGQMWINTERRIIRIALPCPEPEKNGPPTVLGIPLQSDSLVIQQYKINEYVNLVLGFAFAFAVAFQTPVVVLLLGWSGIVDVRTFRRQRKYALLVCAVIAAVVTPPDAFSMLSLVIPMYALYEIGLLLLTFLPAERVARGFGKPEAGSEPAPSVESESVP